MGSDNWFRNEVWNQDIEKAFFDRLSRSRSQKSQYIKIQASYFINSYPNVVLQLSKFLRENSPDDFWEQELCLYESKALYNLKNVDLAISKAKESLKWRAEKPNVQTEIPYWYTELVLKSGIIVEYGNCLEVLNKFHDETPLPVTQFYFFGYSAILLHRLNDVDAAKSKAAEALNWASMKNNLLQNINKQNIGLFKRKSEWPYSEIERIASQ